MYRLMLSCWVTRHESRPSFGNIISSIPLMFTSKSVQKPSDHKHGHGYVEFSKRPFRKHFKVDRYIIRVTKEIYRGKYSHIYEGMARTQDDSDSVKNVAVKEVTDEASDKSSMQREIDLMKSIPAHENVIKLLAHSIKEGPPYFVTEFAQHGNLQQYLIKNRQHFIKGGTIESHRQLFSFAKDISCGMEHLSRIGVTHNYLAAKHVLVFTETTCKIANFGYASNVTHGKRTLSMEKKDTHPYQWMALETLTKWEFDTFTDVWAFGVVLWEIVTLGKKPFEGYQQRDVKWRISKGDRLYKPIHCSDEVYDVMLACWRKKPKDRPTFSKLVDITKRLRDRRDELLYFSKYK
ncbi:tyrosine kinase receptor Cad96Ca-like [Ptychodera flava]|uniref:tyrosine kinase receptor Cad96Ca-like n=1 Tax=Ptychodera flava TaxID=63121 RepID=UPI00396A5BE9